MHNGIAAWACQDIPAQANGQAQDLHTQMLMGQVKVSLGAGGLMLLTLTPV